MKNIYEDLSDEELLDIFVSLVKIDHYDPTQTPQNVVTYRKLGYTQYSARSEILRRLINGMHDDT